jgi:hypothetical protein
MNERVGVSNEGLILETQLPVGFRPGEKLGDQFDSRDKLYNLRILQAYDVLEDHAHFERSESENPLAGDIRKLDSKLSLLLQLFGEWLRERQPPPPVCALKLDRHGIDCALAIPIDEGAEGVMELYVHPFIPIPVRWRATAGAVLADGRQHFAFEALSELEMDQLERLLFLAHRQQVADQRRIQR